MTTGLFEEVRYATAEEFISALCPFHDAWGRTGGVKQWVFRGQADADWKLQASAMRPRALRARGIGHCTPLVVATLDEQLTAEQNALMGFVTACHEAALVTPEDGQWLRSHGLLSRAFGKQLEDDLAKGIDFPHPLLRSLFALAQHHGVPTRLLDWSQVPYTAAYFPASEVATALVRPERARRARSGTHLAVWALRNLLPIHLNKEHRRSQFDPTVDYVEAPYDTNAFLAAQRGLFTLVRFHTARNPNDFIVPGIDEVLGNYERHCTERRGGPPSGNGPWLRKLTLPHTQARRLLRLLGDINVNAATVRPHYESIVAALDECELHQ